MDKATWTETEAREVAEDMERKKYFEKDVVWHKLKDGDCVTLVNYSGFQTVFVMPIVTDGSMIHLADDIAICQRSQEEAMSVLPEVGEIILALYRMNGEAKAYYRCAVASVSAETQKILVRFLESGEEAMVVLADCKYANDFVAKHPIKCCKAYLDGIYDCPSGLMFSRVQKYFCGIGYKKLLVTVKKGGKSRLSIPYVQLHYQKMVGGKHEMQQICVNDEILETEKWFWETSFENGNLTDQDIFKSNLNMQPLEELRVSLHELPVEEVILNEELDVKISQFFGLEKFICMPMLQRSILDYEVFMNQIQKYMNTVATTPYFPGLGEVVLMKDNRNEKDIWVRGGRANSITVGDYMYHVDTGEITPMEFCEFRKIPIEFTRVGTFAIYASIIAQEHQKIEDLDSVSIALGNVFAPDTVHKMRVESIDRDTAVVTFTCPDLEEKLAAAMHHD